VKIPFRFEAILKTQNKIEISGLTTQKKVNPKTNENLKNELKLRLKKGRPYIYDSQPVFLEQL